MHGYFRSSIKISTGRARVANRFQSGGLFFSLRKFFPDFRLGPWQKISEQLNRFEKISTNFATGFNKSSKRRIYYDQTFFFLFFVNYVGKFAKTTSISCSKFVRHRMLITGTFLWPNTSINLHLKFQHRQVWSVAGISRRSDVVARVKKKLG